MRTLHRYILRSFISSFLSCLLVFIALYIIVDLFGRLDELIKRRILTKTVIEYYINLLPAIFIQMSPMAILLAALHSFGNLTRNNETTAIKAGGISLSSIAYPALLIGLIVSVFSLWVGEYSLPHTAARARRIKQEELKNRQQKHIWKNVVFYSPRGRRFFLRELNTAEFTATGVEITELDASGAALLKLQAKSARWEEEKWSFADITMYKFNHSGETEEFITANTCKVKEKNWIFLDGSIKKAGHSAKSFSLLSRPYPEFTEGPSELTRMQQMPDEMNYLTLKRRIERLKAAGFTPRAETVELYNKLSLPFINLILVIIGISVGISKRRGGAFINFGEAFLATFLFYILTSISAALGKDILPPIVSSLLPNAVFLFIGAALFRRINLPA